MENGRKELPGRRTCSVCIFFDVCDGQENVCAHFYSDGSEEWLLARDERERKIEYLVEWEAYIDGF